MRLFTVLFCLLGSLLTLLGSTPVPIPFSQEPRATVVNTNDDVILNSTNGGTGTWTTKRGRVADVAAALAPLIPLPAGTSNAWKLDATNAAAGVVAAIPVAAVNTNAGLMSSNYVATLGVSPKMRMQANWPLPMGVQLFNDTESQLTTTAAWMVSSGLRAAGYNILRENCGWDSNLRDGNGNITAKASYFPNGIYDVVTNLAAYGCQLTLHLEMRQSPGLGNSCDPNGANTCPATAYQDGYFLGSNGVRGVWLDWYPWTGLPDLAGLRYATEQFLNGLDDGSAAGNWPYAVNLDADVFSGSIVQRWMPTMINALYVQTNGDLNTTGPASTMDAYNQTMFKFPWTVTPTCTKSSQGYITRGLSTWANTNYVRYGIGSCCLGPTPLYINATTVYPEEWALVTNREAIRINQDVYITACQLVQSNSAGLVVSRPLANGDLAVGFFNNHTNAANTISVPIGNLLGVGTDASGVISVIDCFDGVITAATNTLSALVNTGSCNLYRLLKSPSSSSLGLTTNYQDANNIIWSFKNGALSSIIQGFPTIGNTLPAMQLWFKADSVSYGSPTLTNWPDSSGHGWNASNGAAWQAVWTNNAINGKPAFQFGARWADLNWPGSDTASLVTPYTATDSNFTAFLVFEVLTSIGNWGAMISKGDWIDNYYLYGFDLSDGQSGSPAFKPLVFYVSSNLFPTAPGTAYCVCYVRSGDVATIYGSGTNTYSLSGLGTGLLDNYPFTLGASDQGGVINLPFSGLIAEAIYCNTNLPLTSITNTMGALRYKYNVP